MSQNKLLLGAIVLSALAVITVRSDDRILFQHWAAAETSSQRLDVEWGKLLLEQGTFAAHARIGKIARSDLSMVMPASGQIVLVYDNQRLSAHAPH
ncbi:MAG TPA: cell division protein FtsL [Acidiferrobacteraceae bacterium]|nr:cell division protein FtsL [Acidiferrobacteraceae bacterium]